MVFRAVAFASSAFILSACGGSVSTPDMIRGIWGTDCTRPFVSFTQDSIHVYPDNATYSLDYVTFDGNNLTVKYSGAQGVVTETYVKSGETLRLDHGTYNGVDATWNKRPMDRCPAS